MATVSFAVSLFGLFVASFLVLVGAFSVAIHATAWPRWLRLMALFAIFLGYWGCILSLDEGLTGYRLATITAVAATYRVARGFARTFLPSFIAAFKAACDTPRP